MNEVTMGILAEVIETPGLPQEDIFNMFAVERYRIIDELTYLLNGDYIDWRIDKSDTCYYPLKRGIDLFEARKIADNTDDIPF